MATTKADLEAQVAELNRRLSIAEATIAGQNEIITNTASAVLTVDVEDGCMSGRVAFIEDNLGLTIDDICETYTVKLAGLRSSPEAAVKLIRERLQGQEWRELEGGVYYETWIHVESVTHQPKETP